MRISRISDKIPTQHGGGKAMNIFGKYFVFRTGRKEYSKIIF